VIVPEAPYADSFACIPDSVTYRAPRTTPKPIVAGSQTAVVSGPAGEEIYTDEYGRVKVQFHWDRYGKSDSNSSCWIRVSQTWAGSGWGQLSIPRIGQEVVVEFLQGDPDRPIITGRVYNGDVDIKTGGASITMKKSGDITIKGKKINTKASSDIVMKGKKILQN
jgi:type VI secretion system secreted protein VgrG